MLKLSRDVPIITRVTSYNQNVSCNGASYEVTDDFLINYLNINREIIHSNNPDTKPTNFVEEWLTKEDVIIKIRGISKVGEIPLQQVVNTYVDITGSPNSKYNTTDVFTVAINRYNLANIMDEDTLSIGYPNLPLYLFVPNYKVGVATLPTFFKEMSILDTLKNSIYETITKAFDGLELESSLDLVNTDLTDVVLKWKCKVNSDNPIVTAYFPISYMNNGGAVSSIVNDNRPITYVNEFTLYTKVFDEVKVFGSKRAKNINVTNIEKDLS